MRVAKGEYILTDSRQLFLVDQTSVSMLYCFPCPYFVNRRTSGRREQMFQCWFPDLWKGSEDKLAQIYSNAYLLGETVGVGEEQGNTLPSAALPDVSVGTVPEDLRNTLRSHCDS